MYYHEVFPLNIPKNSHKLKKTAEEASKLHSQSRHPLKNIMIRKFYASMQNNPNNILKVSWNKY